MSTEKLASDTSFSLSSAPEPAICPEAERLVRKQETALGYRIMASWGWGADGSGHITARDPERTDAFWSLRYGVPFGEARVEDLVLVNHSGDVIEGSGEINPAGFCILLRFTRPAWTSLELFTPARHMGRHSQPWQLRYL